ncbi:MAG: HAD-IIIA family hydrolase [Victivallales bacterium]|nr:HAD-IIIA family hydrolase [Victivallales bacterium]
MKMENAGAVFLDRDGTLIEDRGDLSCASHVEFFDDTFAALSRLGERYKLFIVTNQPGVALGRITIEDVRKVNDYVSDTLRRHGVDIIESYVCPHARGDGCGCIKPNVHFLKIAEADHAIDLRRSFVVGDHPHDVELARNAGATGIYVLTGHGRRHLDDVPEGAMVAGGILEAAGMILPEGEGAPKR